MYLRACVATVTLKFFYHIHLVVLVVVMSKIMAGKINAAATMIECNGGFSSRPLFGFLESS